MTDRKESPETAACGCCAAAKEEKTHSNRPGLPALEYRTGTHGSFLRRMIKKLPLQEIADDAGQPVSPLRELTTQDTSDPAIALLDAWAVAADVLTFYQERIANECYLRTATERRSVMELAREISYELNPGLAASTYLAFTIADTEGSPESVTIPQGTRVMSLPAPGKLPQTFETGAELVARPEWNALKPKITKPHALVLNTLDAYLQGIGLGLKSGDYLLFVGEERTADPINENWDIRQITEIKEFPDESYTCVSWQEGLGWKKDGHRVIPAENPRIYAFRQRAALFGYNAPDWRMMSFDLRRTYLGLEENAPLPTGQTEWPLFSLFEIAPDRITINLDTLYPKVFADTWCALTIPDYQELYRITAVAEDSKTAFGLSLKTTRLTISGENLDIFNDQIRQTVVFCASEELTAAEEPDETPLSPSDDTVTLDGLVSGLLSGKVLIISGTSPDEGTVISEEVTLMEDAVIDTAGSTTTLSFTKKLSRSYVRSSITIYGNVVPATLGETVSEVLGSGDAGLISQQFTLKKPPLTYVPAPTPSGGQSTLAVRVDELLWTEAPMMYGNNGTSEIYCVRIDDNATATVIFGNGKEGSRLTTGSENVTAVYRSGIGPDGNVEAGSLSILPVRPPGVRAVTNPKAATGAAAPEDRDHARENAPLRVRTFDRIVSLRDYEDFARAYTGIAKAMAVAVWSGEECIVHVTVAGPEGAIVSNEKCGTLLESIKDAQDPGHTVVFDTYIPVVFRIGADVTYDTLRFEEDVVRADIREALLSRFSFEMQSFGEDVTVSDVMSTIQDVAGVVAVGNVRILMSPTLYSMAGTAAVKGSKNDLIFRKRLPARRARFAGTRVLPTMILQISTDGNTINGVPL